MQLPTVSVRDLLEVGAHFGHHPRRWNPKMAPYIFGVRNSVHIINLEKTVPLFRQALQAIQEIVTNGGRVLFVGTKRQASEIVAAEAQRCGQFYVNHRWLGGMLTNWKTVSNSIKRLKELGAQLNEANEGLTKKELLKLHRTYAKLEQFLGGIKEMGGVPDVLFVIDTNKDKIAIQEANKMGIPVVAILDSNSSPEGVTYPVPGNDDAVRSIEYYCRMVSTAVLSGMQRQLRAAGVDLGESTDVLEDINQQDKVTPSPERAEEVSPEEITHRTTTDA
jgi:small subunit ribosomal protein S2